MQNRTLSIVANLFLVIFSIFFTLVLLEIGLRLFYTPTEPLNLEEITPWDAIDMDQYDPPLNEYGFREASYSDDVLRDDFTRILFLGDSFTFGFGVEEGSKRFSDLVESELNIDANQNASASHYHIYNAGVAGTEPEEWLDYLKTLQPLYQPDYVFVIFFLRDGTRLCTSLRCHEEVINGIKSKYTERFLYRYSYLGQFIYSSFIRKEFSDYYEAQVLNSYLGNEEEQAFWREQQQYLLEIRDISEQNGVEFHLVIFPILIDLNGRYPFRQVDEEIIRFANEADISVYSMTDGFIGQDAPSLWVSPTDQHPNEKGHAVAADILFPYVRDIVTP